MTQTLQNIWTSMKATEAQAQELAKFFNKNLVPKEHVVIIKFNDNWFTIAGSSNAKATCDRLTKQIKDAQTITETV